MRGRCRTKFGYEKRDGQSKGRSKSRRKIRCYHRKKEGHTPRECNNKVAKKNKKESDNVDA